MKRGRYQTNKKHNSSLALWLVLLFVLMSIIISVLVFLLLRPDPIQAHLPGAEQAENTEAVKKNSDSIAIPGYERIDLQAGSKQQTVGFNNPAQNTCYFQISLLLEDGTLLWKSKLVKPGEISDPILLSQELQSGTYQNAVLHYDCYTLDRHKTPLNGAEMKLTLSVR